MASQPPLFPDDGVSVAACDIPEIRGIYSQDPHPQHRRLCTTDTLFPDIMKFWSPVLKYRRQLNLKSPGLEIVGVLIQYSELNLN